MLCLYCVLVNISHNGCHAQCLGIELDVFVRTIYYTIQQLFSLFHTSFSPPSDATDAQKDEAILRTFRGVSRHFSEVFAELVPGGAGQLIMRTTMDQEQEKNKGKGGGKGKSKKAAGGGEFKSVRYYACCSGQ